MKKANKKMTAPSGKVCRHFFCDTYDFMYTLCHIR